MKKSTAKRRKNLDWSCAKCGDSETNYHPLGRWLCGGTEEKPTGCYQLLSNQFSEVVENFFKEQK